MEKEREPREFNLETVLAVIIGQPITNDYDDIIEMAQYVYRDPLMNTISFQIVRSSFIDYIYSIHPELKEIKYEEAFYGDLDKWLAALKTQYGETLPIPMIGYEEKQEHSKKKVKRLRSYSCLDAI